MWKKLIATVITSKYDTKVLLLNNYSNNNTM